MKPTVPWIMGGVDRRELSVVKVNIILLRDRTGNSIRRGYYWNEHNISPSTGRMCTTSNNRSVDL